MPTTTRLTALMVCAAAAGCGLPGRDNPEDPGSAPKAVLLVRVGNVEALDGTRNTQFTFDATGSAPGLYSLDLDAPAIGDAQFDTPMPGGLLTTQLSLTSAMLPAGGVGQTVRNIRLRVTNAAGHHGYAQRSVSLHNAAPRSGSLDVYYDPERNPPVVLDACDGRQPAQCLFDDPDGDALTFTWHPLDPLVVLEDLGDPDHRRQRFHPVDGTRRYEFLVEESDGLSTTTGRVAVFGEQVMWASTILPNRVMRSSINASSRNGFRTPGGVLQSFARLDAIALAPDHSVWVGEDFGNVRHLGSSLREIQEWPMTGDQSVVALAPASSGLTACAAVAGADSGFFRLLANGTAQFISAPVTGSNSFRSVLSAGDAGCYTVGDTIGLLDTAGNWTELAAPDVPFGGLEAAVVTGDGALWVEDFQTRQVFRMSAPGQPLVEVPIGFAASLGPMVLAPDFAYRVMCGTQLLDPSGTLGPVLSGPLDGGFARSIVAVSPESSLIWVEDEGSYDVEQWEYLDGVFVLRVVYHLEDLIADASSLLFYKGWSATPDGTLAIALQGSPSQLVRVPPHAMIDYVSSQLEGDRISVDPSTGNAWVDDIYLGVSKYDASGALLFPPSGSTYIASARTDDGAWIGREDLPNPDALDRVDSYGTALESAALPGRIVALDTAENGDACFVAQISASLGGAFRKSPGSAAVPLAGSIPACASGLSARARAAADGSCWFLAYTTSACTAEHLFRIPEGSTVTSADVALPGAVIFEPLATDARDSSAWTSVGTSVVRYSVTGANLYTAPAGTGATTLEVVVSPGCKANDASSAADPGCVEVWRTPDTGFINGSRLLRSDGRVDETLEVLKFGSTGTPASLDAP